MRTFCRQGGVRAKLAPNDRVLGRASHSIDMEDLDDLRSSEITPSAVSSLDAGAVPHFMFFNFSPPRATRVFDACSSFAVCRVVSRSGHRSDS